MAYLSKKIQAIKPYTAGDQPQGPCIKLNTNENPFPPSPRVQKAIKEQIPLLNLYPQIGAETLVAAIAQREGLPEGWVFAGNGSDEVLALCFPAFGDEDTPLRMPALTYSFYPVYATLFSLPYVRVPLRGLDIDVDSLLAGGNVILANPNAPTGRALSLDTLARMGRCLRDRGEVLIVDEAYIAFGGQSARPLLEELDNLLITRTLSKDHSLAGLRVGYALGHPQLIDGLRRAKDSFNSYPVDRLAIAAATAALQDEPYFAACRDAIVETREFFHEGMVALGFEPNPSCANFVFMRHPQVPGKRIYEALKARRVFVRRFDQPGIEDYLRISIGSRQDMETLLRLLKDCLPALRGQGKETVDP